MIIDSQQAGKYICLVFRIHYSKLMDIEKRGSVSLLFRIRDNLECQTISELSDSIFIHLFHV